MGFIKRSWRGEEKLSRVFWLYYVLGEFILFLFLFLIVFLISKVVTSVPPFLIFLIYVIPVLGYFIWIFVSLWRCAFNSNWKGWGYLIRTCEVTFVISFFGGILFGILQGIDGGGNTNKLTTEPSPSTDNESSEYKELLSLSNAGDAKAQLDLGRMYYNGQGGGGVAKDLRKARALYEKSAAQGNNWSQSNLGTMYEKGLGGLAKDLRKARELYEKSAAQGNAGGQANLGVMYRDGQGGLSKDLGKARELFEKSAAQGNATGQNNLGWMYETGLGGFAKDKQKARELYEKSAAQGDEYATEALRRLR